jgi:membrane fusion protein (multidrug efflux system)
VLQQSKLFIFITASWIILSGCEEKISTNNKPNPTIEVGVISVQEQAIPLQQELSGRVKAKLVSEVRPQISGIITKQLFTEGSFVNQGEILYQIDSATYQANFFQAKASLESAKVTALNAKNKSQRYDELLKFDGTSKQEAEDAKAVYLQAEALVEEKKANLESAKIDL